MGEKLPPHELALYRATDEVLHYIWDPIGVAGTAYARDEYHSYLPTVYSFLKDGKKQEIKDYLLGTVTGRMGLDLSPYLLERTDRAIETLFEWKEKCEVAPDSSMS